MISDFGKLVVGAGAVAVGMAITFAADDDRIPAGLCKTN